MRQGVNDMGVQSIIKSAMKAKNIRSKELAKEMGYKDQAFYNKVSRGTMSGNFLCELGDFLNCDLVFIDRETGEIYR